MVSGNNVYLETNLSGLAIAQLGADHEQQWSGSGEHFNLAQWNTIASPPCFAQQMICWYIVQSTKGNVGNSIDVQSEQYFASNSCFGSSADDPA